MLNRISAIIVVVVSVLIAGCAGAPPISVHPLDTFDDHRPEWAIVIVDLDLETSAGNINGSSLILPTSPTREVFAIYADVGKTFRLDRISVASRSVAHSAYLTFDDAKEISLPRTGIYYYGRVLQRGRNTVIDYDMNAAVVRRAMQKYPAMFQRLEPINFEVRAQ